MSTSIEKLLSLLSGVKPSGKAKWLARCPAHKDKSPSLSIKQVDDGTILVHCFAGCSAQSVLGSISLEPSDLFPPSGKVHAVKGIKGFDAYSALRSLADDVQVVLIACRMAIKLEKLTERDLMRLSLASKRIQEARTFVMGA